MASWVWQPIPLAQGDDTLRRAEVSWVELEVPNALRRAEVSWAELEVPDFTLRKAEISWAELEVPDAPAVGGSSSYTWYYTRKRRR